MTAHAPLDVAAPSSSPAAACPACRSVLGRALAGVLDAQTGEAFDILRCSDCGLGVTSPAPADLDRYYGERYYGGRHWFTERWCNRRRLHMVEAVTRDGPRGLLADIGCGDGGFLLAAKQSGWRVLGTEMNAAMAPSGLEVLGSIDELRARGPFGCITLWHSFEHLRRPVEALTELSGMLAARGALVLAVPDSRGWQARLFGRHWLHLDVPRHLFHFTLPSLRAALDRAGLELTEVRHQEVEYDLFGWVQSALNAFMPRPNILFDALTRRPARVSRAWVAGSAALAGTLFVPALVATWASALAGRGGTLVVAARRRAR